MAKHPVAIKNIIERVLRQVGGEDRVLEEKIHSSWKQIVGEGIATHTKPVGVEKGFLLVYVDSPVWKNDLDRYSKKEILGKVNTLLGKKRIRNINFKIGKVV